MTCPRCYAEFAKGPGSCPECGVHLVRNVSGVMKTSAVMIAAGEERGFYRSVQDVPEPLRARLLEVTTSANSGTIVIADRAGKEQLSLGKGKRQGAEESSLERVAPKHAIATRAQRLLNARFTPWAVAFLLLVAAAILAAVFLTR
jgi:hypothetical protein